MITSTKYRRAFLKYLPDQPLKSVSVKVILSLVVGFILSIVSVMGTLVLLSNWVGTGNQPFIVTKISQDLPLLLIVLIFFYRGRLKESFLEIVPKTANKSLLLIAGSLVTFLAFGVLSTVINYRFIYPPEAWVWLENYIQANPDHISLGYATELSISLVFFIVVAFSEEFVFRFTIYRFLRRHGFLLALVVSSLLFSLLHASTGFVGVLFFAIFITIYYEYTNHFLGAVVIHTFYNLLIPYYVNYLTYLVLR